MPVNLSLTIMFNFFGKISSGVAYALGISMGFAIWALLKKLVRIALVGGGVMAVFHQIGIAPGVDSVGAFVRQFTDLWPGVVDLLKSVFRR